VVAVVEVAVVVVVVVLRMFFLLTFFPNLASSLKLLVKGSVDFHFAVHAGRTLFRSSEDFGTKALSLGEFQGQADKVKQ
jgi:hypothetical protein